jgi:hypothetical protein
MSARPSGVSVEFGIARTTDLTVSIKGAAIADPETGSSPGNLLHLTCCNAFWELRDL